MEPEDRMTWLSTAIDVGRRAGHAIFYVVMALVFVVAVGLGVAGAQDAADGQPVVWGTFTEEECQPSMTGCRSIGRWLSDDRTVLKEGIYLDGHTGRGGTARASYQPSGLTSDGADNIVHIHAATSAGLWFPWVLSAFSAGAVVYYTRKWRRENGRSEPEAE